VEYSSRHTLWLRRGLGLWLAACPLARSAQDPLSALLRPPHATYLVIPSFHASGLSPQHHDFFTSPFFPLVPSLLALSPLHDRYPVASLALHSRDTRQSFTLQRRPYFRLVATSSTLHSRRALPTAKVALSLGLRSLRSASETASQNRQFAPAVGLLEFYFCHHAGHLLSHPVFSITQRPKSALRSCSETPQAHDSFDITLAQILTSASLMRSVALL